MTPHGTRIFNAYTFESTVKFRRSHWLWTRIENVDRDATLLGEDEEHPIGRVQAYTLGYERDVLRGSAITAGFGLQTTFYGLTPEMTTFYGSRPAGLSIFLRIRPTGNMSQHMQMMRRR
jgi:hypothetical protein